ncbi:uncharacterized protein EI90DRAFT_3128739 [Cantharellus anzutake]|uniref:uncharacterized protein n=1 Tax=Cantharellus anzutake TaxID=1750568 RepID=UPI0019048389|nr:uncharacterized protein EI90DRAFT_3128731 [Cantharellus anzutake]XP_038912249.1 uncharacterized protein EI90DRAFT_3128739 [Cantharellus anzutake]KAF8325387.1 hypothetical protein EI90DRAFT_3128731 [Cantharellus anzutake]KAF8325392.1 hypothetical protein EI90DRAFT_3128739 [Cantharellus anzutake]
MGYTVAKTNQGYKAAYEERFEKYSWSAGASALFYFSNPDGNEEQGVRIEAPEILKEFIDNVAYGRDPVGTLFYNNIDDIRGKTKYNVIYSDTSVKDENAAVIVQFFGSNENQGNFYAEFVGRDPARTVWWIVDGTTHKGGEWHPLKLTTSTAFVGKKSNENKVNITLAAIGKQVSFDLPAGYGTGKNISVWGNLSTNDIKKIKKGTRSVVDYNNDRILFYPQNRSKDLTAVFIPLETKDSDATALGNFRWVSPDEAALWDDYDGDDN